jgi:hypothetical protein
MIRSIGFFDLVLASQGVSRTWVSWIKIVLENGTIAVKVNN